MEFGVVHSDSERKNCDVCGTRKGDSVEWMFWKSGSFCRRIRLSFLPTWLIHLPH